MGYPQLKVKYNGPTSFYTGTDTGVPATFTLFNSVTSFGGADQIPMHGLRRLTIDEASNKGGTLKVYKSQDRGVTWIQTQSYDLGSTAATAYTRVSDVLIEMYADVKAEFSYTATCDSATFFSVDMLVGDSRNPIL